MCHYLLNKLKSKWVFNYLILKEVFIIDVNLIILNNWVLISPVIIDDYIKQTLSVYQNWNYNEISFIFYDYIAFVESNNDLLYFLNPNISIDFKITNVGLPNVIDYMLKSYTSWYMTTIHDKIYIIEKNWKMLETEIHHHYQLKKQYILLPYKGNNVYVNLDGLINTYHINIIIKHL